MKAIRIGLIALALLAGALLIYVLSNAIYTPRPVGFQMAEVPQPGGAPIAVAIWYPADATPIPTTLLGMNLLSVAHDASVVGTALPLVVISHGNGGGPGSHVDLALDLAAHGFVVAAPMHAGDNYADQSAVGTAKWLPTRTREIHATIDYLLTSWPASAHIDGDRIGLFGFSAGGFTALTAIGGRPDLHLISTHCAANPEFACTLLAGVHSPLLSSTDTWRPEDFNADPRVKAAVVAAPGFGFTFAPDGLSQVTVPVQVWTGDADQSVPTATNAGPVSAALGSRAELVRVPGASHFSFLVPCGLSGPPLLCGDAGGFDRKRFHQAMNTAVVAFFVKTL